MIQTMLYIKKLLSFLLLNLTLLIYAGSAGATDFNMEYRNVTGVGPFWKVVKLEKKFIDPVIVCSGTNRNNTTPVTACIRNVSATSFELKLQTVLNESIVSETVDVFVIEKGHWSMAGGGRVEALTIRADAFHKKNSRKFRNSVNLTSRFRKPVVLCTVIEKNSSVPVTASVRNLTRTSFYIQLEQPCYPYTHAEDVNIIVSEDGYFLMGEWTSEEVLRLSRID